MGLRTTSLQGSFVSRPQSNSSTPISANLSNMSLKAVCVLVGEAKGTLTFTQEGSGPVKISGDVSNLKPGLHGFHIHEFGETTNGCTSTSTSASTAARTVRRGRGTQVTWATSPQTLA